MLFNSPEFLLVFLPVVLAGFFAIGAMRRPEWAILWLVAASLFFYVWWRWEFGFLIVGSIAFNYLVGLRLGVKPSRALLAVGVAANLAVIGWFKYSGFFATIVNDLTGAGLPIPAFLLPLGISFYTFQQIAYLVDAYSREAHETSLSRYALFVTFFPQLIAGPIVHHKEMLSQFHDPATYRPRLTNLMLGLTAFSIGLFKKVFIADPMAPHALLAFGPAAEGMAPPMADAWLGAVAYTLQLYFDFSGYSDMAIGLGLMFGIRLPINFASPYKAASIIEFWSRWHMTLTRFLTGYVYNPLLIAITRRRMAKGKPMYSQKRPEAVPFLVQLTVPTLVTFFLAGIWHGAGWQFLVFGLIHGLALVVNHAWHALRLRAGLRRSFGMAGRAVGVAVTFAVVTFSLVFFRADSLSTALLVVQGMAGNGGPLDLVPSIDGPDVAAMGTLELLAWRLKSVMGVLVVGALAIVWVMPNTPQYVEKLSSVMTRMKTDGAVLRWPLLRWKWPEALPLGPRFIQGGAVGVVFGLALLRSLSDAPTEFLYFTF